MEINNYLLLRERVLLKALVCEAVFLLNFLWGSSMGPMRCNFFLQFVKATQLYSVFHINLKKKEAVVLRSLLIKFIMTLKAVAPSSQVLQKPEKETDWFK